MPQLLLRFCTIGSLLGGGVFVAVRDILSATAQPQSVGQILLELAGIPLWAVLSSFLSVPFGFLPATVAALLYWQTLSRYTHHNPNLLARAGLGGVLGCAAAATFGGFLFAVRSGPGMYPATVSLLAWASAGFVGGATSALAVRHHVYEIAFKHRHANRVA
jgi:hypothetical protein